MTATKRQKLSVNRPVVMVTDWEHISVTPYNDDFGNRFFLVELESPDSGDSPDHFRLTDHQWFVLSCLDGRTSIAEMQQRFPQEVPNSGELFDDSEPAERPAAIAKFITECYQGFLVNKPGQVRKRPKPAPMWQEALQNPFSVRIGVFNPDRSLDILNVLIGWMFSWPMVVLSLMALVMAMISLASSWEMVSHRIPQFHEFFGAQNWLFLFFVWVMTKLAHEYGHGLAAKRYGYRVPEMGILFLVGQLCFFTDVSAINMEPNKWRKTKVALAGIYVELVIATVATFLWLGSQPGMVAHTCLAIMFSCTVNTLIFNLNPLMRFDAYWVLAFLWDRPKLREDATQLIRSWIVWFFTDRWPETSVDGEERLPRVVIWGIASTIWRWKIVVFISIFVWYVTEPYHLQWVALAYTLWVLGVRPLWFSLKALSRLARGHGHSAASPDLLAVD